MIDFPNIAFHELRTPIAHFTYAEKNVGVTFLYHVAGVDDDHWGECGFEFTVNGQECEPYTYLSVEEWDEYIDEVNQFNRPELLPKPPVTDELKLLIATMLDRFIDHHFPKEGV